MELSDLVGIRALDAADYGEIRDPRKYKYAPADGTVNVLRMRLGGVTYVCEEDPDDGYRSSMQELRTLREGEKEIENVFGYVLVDCRYESKHCDILKVVDIKSGEVVITVGTDRTDDYYPTFVANWNPAGLYFNKER